MEQHGSALPVVRRPSVIAKILAHICNSVLFLKHMPREGGGGGGVVCGGGGIVGDGPGQVNPCGILRPVHVLKKMFILGDIEKGFAPTDLHRQARLSMSERLRTMEQHGSAFPVVRRPSVIAKILAHICDSVLFLKHMPLKGGGGGGVVCGGGGIVGDGSGQVKPCGILRPVHVLKKMFILGDIEKGFASTDLHRQARLSISERLRTMEQHGSALPVVRRPSVIARMLAHICDSVLFLKHMPREGGGGGGVVCEGGESVAGGGGGVICGGGGGLVCGRGGNVVAGGGGGVICGGGESVVAGGGGGSGSSGWVVGGGCGVAAGGGNGWALGGGDGGGWILGGGSNGGVGLQIQGGGGGHCTEDG
ncbi:unnamed protein product [Thlaspi arvense]|uniref:Uncharacterized protein n=1 Tax=Thlaspi arvense TaxID=13288 RepID=A0AAU9T6I1_THLAR|nr:unnamed protein product [Thlaspi arvense]